MQDKSGLPSKGEILYYWKDWLLENRKCIDIGEPSCWACGIYYGTTYDIEDSHATDDDIKRLWNKTPFQICHIVPKSLGGSNEVSNLFLLCKECHDLAPDSISVDNFLKWAKNQDYNKRWNEEIKSVKDDFELSDNDLGRLFKLFFKVKDKPEFKDMLGIHFNQLYGGAHIKTSSLISVLIEMDRLYRDEKDQA